MALFGGKKSNDGGFMDVIRCDEPSYLIWKWHPTGTIEGGSDRENSIRWGSSLRVKDGEVAVLVYEQSSGVMQDYVEGPFDQVIETENFPLIAKIISLAYQGKSPYQAEIYFINLAQIIQVPFAVPFFDIFDPRFTDFGVPVAVRGKLTFNISDYKNFIKLHRLSTFNLRDFQIQIRDAMARYVKGIVANIPTEKNIPVIQIEKELAYINEQLEKDVRERFEHDFGVNITAVDINAIEIDKASEGYRQLKRITQDLAMETARAKTAVDVKNMHDMQRINAENMDATMRIQREESQYAQHMQTQMSNYAAYQLEQQAAVGIAGAQALGGAAQNGAADLSGNGINAAAMIGGMAIGGAVGQNIAGVVNGMMQGMTNGQQAYENVAPPPIPVIAYHVAVNGKAEGPYELNVLEQMASSGALTKDTLVWKKGMAGWEKAGAMKDLEQLFELVPPPIPGEQADSADS